jgi:hypothetical protein
LGSESATETEVRRAYRRAIVRTHRTGVLDIVAELESLKRAYDVARAPAAREIVRARPAPGRRFEPSGPRVGVRSEASLAIQRHSIRTGAVAKRENAEVVRTLVDEHDRRELAARREASFRRRVDLALRLARIAALTAGAAWLLQYLR